MNFNKSMNEESKVRFNGLISGEEKLREVNEDVIIFSEDMTKRSQNKHSFAETANTNS